MVLDLGEKGVKLPVLVALVLERENYATNDDRMIRPRRLWAMRALWFKARTELVFRAKHIV